MSRAARRIELPENLRELLAWIDEHATVEVPGGGLTTVVSGVPMFDALLEQARAFRSEAVDERETVRVGRVLPGAQVDGHTDKSRETVVTYLSHGAPVFVDGEQIEIEPGLMTRWSGDVGHRTGRQPAPHSRYTFVVEFGRRAA